MEYRKIDVAQLQLVFLLLIICHAVLWKIFYISPEFRHNGIARQLVQFAYRTSGVSSMTVGCADCDVQMYESLGFSIHLGNLLAFGE